jgi:hypothetical protein
LLQIYNLAAVCVTFKEKPGVLGATQKFPEWGAVTNLGLR